MNFLIDGPKDSHHTLVLAHGAGGAMDTPFLNVVARGVAARGIRVVRFEFPYMAARRTGEKFILRREAPEDLAPTERRTWAPDPEPCGLRMNSRPDRQPVLLQAWRDVVAELGACPERSRRGGAKLVIGGKSLGGRIASMVAGELRVSGVVCLGYPFHPPGQPARLRTEHLEALATPALIVQGTRDPFGTREDVAAYRISPTIRIEWLEDGDHSFRPRKSSGSTEGDHLARAVDLVAGFVTQLT